MGHTCTVISDLGVFSRNYAELLAKGIDPAIAARKPIGEVSGSRTSIDTNHATFVFGHLALYPNRIFTLLGDQTPGIAAPEHWEPLFKAGAPCVDDPQGTVYPSFQEVASHYFRTHDAACALLRTADDRTLELPNPNENSRARFATIGHIANFLLVGHVMMHMGQVSAWRRCFGLPSAMS